MNNLAITDINNNMADAFAVTIEYKVTRLKITDGYRCANSCLNTCTSRNGITEMQVKLLCKS